MDTTERQCTASGPPAGSASLLAALVTGVAPARMRELEAASLKARGRWADASEDDAVRRAVEANLATATPSALIDAIQYALIEARSLQDEALREFEIAELQRHLAPLASAIGLIWGHVKNGGPWSGTLCCTGETEAGDA